ncbi:hypothetical protein [Sulfitobacter sp. M368]|uniref:hypothetical protein n=1 Tax=Sulfitobacter sp. M368 TaxID=2867021 RepID=UPI0021A7109C|nr:hypothetical protein [Sulfitobacter sp. M368]UWR16690.1 hypothetical protein K3754_07390 [Sulfitobacter sp. M368]
MALTPYADASSMTLIISVQNDGSVAQMGKDLNDALTLVREGLSDVDLFHYTIDLSGTWRPGDCELAPWDEPFSSAWQKLIAIPAMREPLAAWLGSVVSLIKENQDKQFKSISEHDLTQFGEVPASYLAFADKGYVPIYTDLLGVWDLGHAVSQFGVVEQLIAAHGENADTNSLKAAVADWL